MIENKCTFIFDVDGTLTPSRQPMNENFKKKFLEWADEVDGFNHKIFLVTGSDRAKTVEQIGEDIFNKVSSFNCLGNMRYEKGELVSQRKFNVTNDVIEFLESKLSDSSYPIRTGNHLEYRDSMLNFSVVGRNATLEQRKEYVAYDTKSDERNKIAEEFNSKFTDYQAQVGGEISIDVIEKGFDKSQIAQYVDSEHGVIFLGDKMNDGGNDYPLMDALEKRVKDKSLKFGVYFKVQSWKETEKLLPLLYSVIDDMIYATYTPYSS